ncbi:MAG: trypsin-like peptidase domain-containing protein, partial [Proteobacteria bacterium]|nr:trypsin-like peptidase domain-containing protein [Pseudomonadota bacterium]
KQLANHPPLAVRQESPEADRQPLQPQTRTAPPPQGFPTEQRPVEPVDGSVARGDAIEQAKQATVAIETPWGSVGSGFFITPTLVVTNRHVVEQDNKGLDELRHQIQTRRKMLALEQEQIDQLRKWIRTAPDGPGRRQAALAAQEKERNLAKLIPLQEEAEKRLRMMEETKNQLAIKIFLADGSEQYPQAIRTSPNRDLALITVYGGDGQPLKAAGGLTLREGDKVFTIGNPSGLRHTVTAGIFSGYRKDLDTGGVVLQTDAAINPGNSGGPLIDEQGRVHGVNYMIYRNTQGIGFAIPIQAVFDEFSLLP